MLDILLAIILIGSLISGVRRGFIVGAYEIAAAVLGLVIATLAYPAVGALIGSAISAREAILNILAFILTYGAVQMLALTLLQPVVRAFRKSTGIIPGASLADRIAGSVPGLVHGFLLAGILVLALGFFPTSSFPGRSLEDSNVGLRLYREMTGATIRVASVVGFDFSDFYSLTPRSGDQSYVLPFEADQEELEAAPQAEEAMLALVNEERLQRGLEPLVVDPELTAVARSHSVEMFVEGYFAHESPITGTPFDRLAAAGINYSLAGENLAYAPSVERAHEGLMDSPGHRENILEPGFGRVGIGAINADGHGTMYTQLFANDFE